MQSLADLFTEAHEPEPTQQISLLLGSGFSRTDGIPLMADINYSLVNLTIDDFYLSQSGEAWFYKGEEPGKNELMTRKDREFAVAFIGFYIQSELENNPDAFDYEVFFDYSNDFMNNKSKCEEICGFCDSFLNEREKGFNGALQLVSKFLNVFNQLIASLLSRAKYYGDISYTGAYPLYENFCAALGKLLKHRIVNVHTLNHDLLFDYMARNVSGMWDYFTDGFSEMESNYYGELSHASKIDNELLHKHYKVRVPIFTNKYNNRLRLFKLHGSVDYYSLYLQEDRKQMMVKRDYGVGEIYRERFNPRKENFDYDRPFYRSEPSYLTGTTNKIKRYGDYFYDNLFVHFSKNLQESEQLIVIGYGFKDQGINDFLEADFLSLGKKIMVIDVKKPEAEIVTKYYHQFNFKIDSISYLPDQVYLWFCGLGE